MTRGKHGLSRQIRDLKARIRRLEGIGRAGGGVLPLGLEAVDRVLPDGGLALGAVHEMRGAPGPVAGFAAFLLGLVAARGQPVLWLDGTGDLYFPGLQPYGLGSDDVILASGIRGDGDVLWALEEALSTPALGAVAGFVDNPDFTALRRLQLAARDHGVTAFLMRKEGPLSASAAVTRWHVAAQPSMAGDLPGIGAPGWILTLEKCRGGPEETAFRLWRGEDGWTADASASGEDVAAAAMAG